ncbi:serine/threonine protein kinase [Streptomyces sp. NPDC050743]|uniref:serine/threonine protein kinase n=1 Tax=Streptomyces sp. NPDC050743 TaxID=3365634 RepID=UPI0037BB1841
MRSGDPKQVGPFCIESRLGSGGMGRVYLGSADKGESKAAIKIIKPEQVDDPEFRRRFAREVAAAVRIRHPRTVRVLDFDVTAAEPWLATEYVQGPSLHQRISEHGPLSVEEAVAFGSGIAQGLSAIHAAGLVHRDLKPCNVMLAGDGPKIIDFGLAYTPYASALTGTGTPLGTPGYFSPEQAQGLRVSPAADVFSFGALLAFAVSGRAPFGTGDYPALLWRIVNEEPDVSSVPDALRGIICACLAKHPKDRPSLKDVLHALEAAASQPGTSELKRRMRVVGSLRARKFARSSARRRPRTKRRGVIAAAVTLSVLSGAAVGWISSHDSGSNSPNNEAESRESSQGARDAGQGAVPEKFAIPARNVDPLRQDWENRTYAMYVPTASTGEGAAHPIVIKRGQSRETRWGHVYLTQVLHTAYRGTPLTFAVLNYAFKMGSDSKGFEQFYTLNCLKYQNGRYEVVSGQTDSSFVKVSSPDAVGSKWETWQVIDQGKLVQQNKQKGTATVFSFDDSCSVDVAGGYDPTDSD